jgi:hypothetical protein
MNEKDTIQAVMDQARIECVADAPDNPTESELSAMYTRRALIICERRQGALEATQAQLVEAIAREQLWAYSTPEKPEGWTSADEMVRATFDEIDGSRSRRCLMRGVATVCEYAEIRGIDTAPAVREWGKFRDMLPEMKRACTENDRARLSSILTDVVEIPDRETLREKHKSGDKPLAGQGAYLSIGGELYYIAHVTDPERAAPILGKLFGDNLVAIGERDGDVVRIRAFEGEQLGDVWEGALEEEPELVPVPCG